MEEGPMSPSPSVSFTSGPWSSCSSTLSQPTSREAPSSSSTLSQSAPSSVWQIHTEHLYQVIHVLYLLCLNSLCWTYNIAIWQLLTVHLHECRPNRSVLFFLNKAWLYYSTHRLKLCCRILNRIVKGSLTGTKILIFILHFSRLVPPMRWPYPQTLLPPVTGLQLDSSSDLR